ncbi:MAG: ABC transporter ATP-binding protein [Candidatus Asgardarchaeia archaeon]
MNKHEYIFTENLTKKYNKKIIALDNVTLRLSESPTCLIGPNGSGKTTFIKIILSLIKNYTGYASILGFDCKKSEKEIKARVGALLEKANFPENIPATKILEFAGRMRGLNKLEAKKQAEILLKNVGLEKAKKRYLYEFSAGMYQRFSLAHALIGDPEIIVLDEPTSNLDIDSKLLLINLINDLQERGKFILISSHAILDLQPILNYVVFIRQGKVIMSGKVSDLIRSVEPQYMVKVKNIEKFLEILSTQSNSKIRIIRIEGNSLLLSVKDDSFFFSFLNKHLAELEIISLSKREDSLISVYKRIMGVKNVHE